MNKKEYIQPHIKVRAFRPNTILAGSIDVNSGTTNEQNAKSSFGLEDDGLDIGLDDDIIGTFSNSSNNDN